MVNYLRIYCKIGCIVTTQTKSVSACYILVPMLCVEREKLKELITEKVTVTKNYLVPKLCLGTQLSAKLCFVLEVEAELQE